MPRVPISDFDDPRLAPYRQLKATNATRDLGLFVVEGETLVNRLLASRYPTDSVLVTDRYEARIADRLSEDLPLYVVPHDRVLSLVGFHFHRGVMASGRHLAWPEVESLLAESAQTRTTLVVCPSLDKPDNLGAILRSGDAFGVDAVLVGSSCPDPLSRRVIRVSMGAALRLPVYVCPDLKGVVEGLRDRLGIELIASVSQAGAEPLDRASRPDRLAILLGSEAFGLDSEWLELADRQVTIPMRPEVDSLNVGVAAAILLYHFARANPDA